MKVVVFHGSPRKGNTYTAAKIFMEALSQCGEVSYIFTLHNKRTF